VSDISIVTGIWDLGRDRAGEGFARPFDHYTSKVAELLEADVPMIVFGDEALRPLVTSARRNKPTHFHARPASHFRRHFDFFDRVQEIRKDPAWSGQAGWLEQSPQATLELYNPMVMSKMFMLHDASIWNPFGTRHFAWIDGAITNTVHPGYFTHDRVLSKVEQFLETFAFVSFPYEGGSEIHGFSRSGMRDFCREDPAFVCRGGFFGGHADCLAEVNDHYYGLLSGTLHSGYMGTEESVFTIMACEEPGLYARHALLPEHHGLLQHFFERVKEAPELPRPVAVRRAPETKRRGTQPPDIRGKTIAGYILTFNAPDQLAAVLDSWAGEMAFDTLFVVDNSTADDARRENAALAAARGATVLTHPRGNIGICGARQFVAEHFAAGANDYCVFLEDDMFLNPAGDAGVCRNGMRKSVPGLRDAVLKIMELESFDFLKLSFTEFYGDNRTQFAWYNVPQAVRLRQWPEQPNLPPHGLDANSPRTLFGSIGAVDGVGYIDGEVYYCNWPQIVSRKGNKTMFLDTVWEHPFEQTWMSHLYQLTLKGELRPAVLLASLVTHNRFHHYGKDERREN
jgi:hypothetical protein